MEPAEQDAARAEANLAMQKESSEMTESAVAYQSNRLASIKHQEKTLTKEHKELKEDLGGQLSAMEEESKSQIHKFEEASNGLAKAKADALKAKETEVAVATEHAAAKEEESNAKKQLQEAEQKALDAEKSRGAASVLIETKGKDLAAHREMHHEALTAYRRENGITAEDEQAVSDTEAAKDLAAAAAKRAAKSSDEAKRIKEQSDKGLTEAESNEQLSSEAVLKAEIQKNNAQSELTKHQLHQQMQAEKVAVLSKQVSDLRITVAGNQDAHVVAQTEAHALVGKAEKLARDSISHPLLDEKDQEEIDEEDQEEDPLVL